MGDVNAWNPGTIVRLDYTALRSWGKQTRKRKVEKCNHATSFTLQPPSGAG